MRVRNDEEPMTAGELVDMIPPGETVHFEGFEITRWPEPGDAPMFREPTNRAARRGNRDRTGRPGSHVRRTGRNTR